MKAVKPPPGLREYLASIGARGGAAGKGPEKKRGDKAHYQRMAAKSAAARKRNRKERQRAHVRAT